MPARGQIIKVVIARSGPPDGQGDAVQRLRAALYKKTRFFLPGRKAQRLEAGDAQRFSIPILPLSPAKNIRFLFGDTIQTLKPSFEIRVHLPGLRHISTPFVPQATMRSPLMIRMQLL
jgi:hypothetical protein